MLHASRLLILTAFTLCVVNAASAGDAPAASAEPVYAHAVVAADHPAASAAGLEILKQGGNVVDAAVAVGFTLSVVRPASSGIGGGGFLLYYDAKTQRATAIDYREQAPARATREMYVDPADPQKVRGTLSRTGHLAVAVPAHVAGLCLALKQHGTRDLPAVLAPAQRLCREGVLVDAHDISLQNRLIAEFREHPEYAQKFAALWRLYLNNGTPWSPEERFRSPLGAVLERIAQHGPDGFYRGPVADALIAEMQRGEGLITHDDLTSIHPTVREPLTTTYRGQTVFTMPPPSSGGVALLETLQIRESFLKRSDHGSEPLPAGRSWHLLAESFKHAFADRAEFLGDSDFADVPLRRLLSAEHAAELAGRIDLSCTRPAESYGRFALPDDGGTTHFSIIDAEGNAVACTETINLAFGSYVVEPTYGIILNNEMDDFTAHPGVPNAFGLKQSEANAIAPGKRPLSSMTPTILVRDGKATVAVGASGGPRIITATTQVLLELAEHPELPAAAVNAPRLHHQWMPHRVELERRVLELPFRPTLDKQLESLGHEVRLIGENAVVQAATRAADGVRGASDPRKHGRAAGY